MADLKLKDLIEDRINDMINSRSTSYSEIHIDNIIDTLSSELMTLGYSVEHKVIDSGEWVDDGKYSINDDYIAKIIINNKIFYIGLSQSRSGSYFTHYDYNAAYLSFIKTDKEYNAPKLVLVQNINTLYDAHFLNNNNVLLVNKETKETLEFVNFSYFLKHIKKSSI